MKKIFFPVFAGLTLCCLFANAQEFKQHISKEFTLPQNAQSAVLAIYNIDGSINVEGYSGDKVVIEVDETIKAETKQTLETGKQEFKLQFDQMADTIMAYISAPYDSRPHRNWNNRGRDDREIEYEYSLSFTVKVPMGMSLDISTVNNGDI